MKEVVKRSHQVALCIGLIVMLTSGLVLGAWCVGLIEPKPVAWLTLLFGYAVSKIREDVGDVI